MCLWRKWQTVSGRSGVMYMRISARNELSSDFSRSQPWVLHTEGVQWISVEQNLEPQGRRNKYRTPQKEKWEERTKKQSSHRQRKSTTLDGAPSLNCWPSLTMRHRAFATLLRSPGQRCPWCCAVMQVRKVANGRQREGTTAEHHSHTTFPLPTSTASHRNLSTTTGSNPDGKFCSSSVTCQHWKTPNQRGGRFICMSCWGLGLEERPIRTEEHIVQGINSKAITILRSPVPYLTFTIIGPYIPNQNVPLSNLFFSHLCVYRSCLCSLS